MLHFNPYPYYFFFSSFFFVVVRYFRYSLLNNFHCDFLHLYNIVIPIINSVTPVNWRRLVWPAEILLWKNNPRCSDQLCSSLWTCRFWFLIFGWLDLFWDPTFITSKIFVHGFCSYFNSVIIFNKETISGAPNDRTFQVGHKCLRLFFLYVRRLFG